MSSSNLWQKILAAPGDERLKAQYIEALARAGDWRAEMFQLAAEIQRLRHGSYLRPAAELEPRYESLLALWRADFDEQARAWSAEVKYVLGWPSEITIKARDFILHAEAIVAILPLRHLNLKAAHEAPEVFGVARLGQIGSLDGSHQRWPRETIAALAQSPHLGSLGWLDLSYTQITDAEVELLAASLHLRNIEHLDLGRNRCRNPVDAHAGYGTDWMTNTIVPESIYLPAFGRELEERYGRINWLHALDNYMERHPPSRYWF